MLSRLRDGELALTPARTSVLLQMVDTVRSLLTSIEASGGEGPVDVSAVIASITAAMDDAPAAAAEVPAPRASQETAPAAKAPAKKAPARRTAAAKKPAAAKPAAAKKTTARKPAAATAVAEPALEAATEILAGELPPADLPNQPEGAPATVSEPIVEEPTTA